MSEVVPIVIGILLVLIVILLAVCKCVEEHNRESEFKRLQQVFENKLSQMRDSYHSSSASEAALTAGVRQRHGESYRRVGESESEEEKEEEACFHSE